MSTLNDTTDARIWSEEFCRIFKGHMIGSAAGMPEFEGILVRYVDEGTMVAWFANAIEIGRNAGRKEMCPHSPEDQFAIADDLSSCRKCGEVFVEPSG
jgi:hypothetical protein